MTATAATALSWNFWSFALFRALTGAGIGGEYTAINSAIQEFVPARFRGRTDLAINGSFWIGAALGAAGAVLFLQPGALPPDWGWRAAFGIGAVLGLGILALRRLAPGEPALADAACPARRGRGGDRANRAPGCACRRCAIAGAGGCAAYASQRRSRTPMVRMVLAIVRDYPQRTVLGLVLMGSQAFFYNAIFFTYALVLTQFYAVPAASIGWYLLPFAIGNFLGPLLLGPLFDRIGRKPMIASTYAISGVLLAIVGYLFREDMVDARQLTLCWSGIFFFASAAASSAYLTVSESFPLEARALAIAFFYAVGTALGGAAAPWLFGILVASGERSAVFGGYLFGAALMIARSADRARDRRQGRKACHWKALHARSRLSPTS